MPRNRSERDPYPVHHLTPSDFLNRYIRVWYRAHYSPEAEIHHDRRTPEQIRIYNEYLDEHRRWAKKLAIVSGIKKAWEAIWPEGQTHITGHQLRDLYRAAQSK